MDKSFSKVTKLNEASNNYAYWQTKSYRERLEAANFLIKIAYQIDEFPPMDKTICTTRKLGNE